MKNKALKNPKCFLYLNKITNNKIPNLTLKKPNILNVNSENNNNKTKNINYLNYRQKLIQKSNSQILESKKILPILNKNISHITSPKINRIHNHSFNRSPVKLENSYFKNKNIIGFISNVKARDKEINKQKKKEHNKYVNISINEPSLLKMSKNSMKLEDKDNKKGINKEIDLNSLKRGSNLENFEEIKNNEANTINSFNNNSIIENKNSSNLSPYKFSKFYQYSKNINVSARQIYEHYISKEINQKIRPIDNFTKFFQKKFSSPKNKLNKLYNIDNLYINNILELKRNNSIAYKDDFNIQEYQKILLGMLKKRIPSNSLFCLRQNFKRFNEKYLKGFIPHKGRYTNLAEKIRDSAPIFLINKLQKLDTEKIKERAKYLKVRENNHKKVDPFDEFGFYLENKFLPNIGDDIK